MSETDFVQPGETTACGHCEPEKYMAVLPCECNCHKASSPKKEGWEDEAIKVFAEYVAHERLTEPAYIDWLIAFIRSLLVSQKEGILAMIEEQRMVWPKMGQEYTLNALKAKIELI